MRWLAIGVVALVTFAGFLHYFEVHAISMRRAGQRVSLPQHAWSVQRVAELEAFPELLSVQDTPPPSNPQPSTIDTKTRARRDAIVEAFKHSWRGYERHAWGYDELRPVSNLSNDAWGGFAVTMVDALDTAYIMGLTAEFGRATNWLAANLTLDRDHFVSVFEHTIRVLGGLLSAYDLSDDVRLLRLAVSAAKALLPAFRTDDGIPSAQVNTRNGAQRSHGWAPGRILAEAGSVQLEFTRLDTILSEERHASLLVDGATRRAIRAAAGSLRLLERYRHAPSGMWPRFLRMEGGEGELTVNGGCDSFYEYLLKLWLLGGRKDEWLQRMYAASAAGIGRHLTRRCTGAGLLANGGALFFGEARATTAKATPGKPNGKMEHLACFAPAMLALGAARGATPKDAHTLAEELLESCWSLYADAPTGLAPDTISVTCELQTRYSIDGAKYSLRPETVESLFVMWRLTHDPKHRERGWIIFESLNRWCRTPAGFSGLKDVRAARDQGEARRNLDDSMPSFWMAEVLKYLYLLFSDDDVLPLDKWTLNTEAHPLRNAPSPA